MRRAGAWPIAALLLAQPAIAQLEEQQYFWQRTHAEDGSWQVVEHGGDATSRLRGSALMTLALLGDGSTSRAGPFREHVKRAAGWLCEQQDDRGRFGLQTTPGWLLDHAMTTYAIAEELRRSGWRRVVAEKRAAVLAPALHAMAREVTTMQPPANVELRLWAAMLTESVWQTAHELATAPETEDTAQRLRLAVVALDVAAASTPCPAPANARERAARRLLDDVHGTSTWLATDAPLPFAEQPMGAPMATLYDSMLLLRRFHSTDRFADGQRDAIVQQLAALKAVADLEHHEHHGTDLEIYGSWSPTGTFGDANGRVGMTAVGMLILECYYRYSQLDVAWE